MEEIAMLKMLLHMVAALLGIVIGGLIGLWLGNR